MISIIICSRTNNLSESLLLNIHGTIGVPYELVVVDNSLNKFNIFQAYNIGISKSTYPYLCFMHDDIIFHTNNWGQIVCCHFENKEVGIIGVAGGKYLSYMPGTWWSSGFWEQNIIQFNDAENKVSRETVIKTDANKTQVFAVDGVWFCVPKKLVSEIKFDEDIFTGFHYYDLDICMQIYLKGYKIYAVFDILIEHSSKGSLNGSWIESALIFHKKWRKLLPLSLVELSPKEQYKLELKILYEFMYILKGVRTDREIYRIATNLLLEYGSAFDFLRASGLILRLVVKTLIS